MRAALVFAVVLGFIAPPCCLGRLVVAASQQASADPGADAAPATPTVPNNTPPPIPQPASVTDPSAPKNPSQSAIKPKASPSRKNAASKHIARPAQASPTAPKTIVVREGGAKEPAEQIVPGMTPQEAAVERQKAERLLSSADLQLKQLADRPLNTQQAEAVSQIHNYMKGANTALHEGDVQRAGTLAEKAYLLSDDLLKH